MHIALSEDQTMLQDTVERVLREHSTGARVRAAEPLGFDAALWKILVDQGIPMLRVAEPHGSDASLMHAVVVSELAGRYLASAPVVESIVTNRLLARLGADALPLLEDCLSGKVIATLALHDAGGAPSQFVPAGAIANVVVCVEGDAVWLRSGFKVPTDAVHGSIPARELNLAAATKSVRVGGKDAKEHFAAAREEWKLLTAAQVTAAARRATEIAGEYACERVAFGRKTDGVDFKAIDDKPVHFFFLIVAPPLEVSNQYLPVLGKIAQFSKESDVPGRLLEINSPADFMALLEEKRV